MPSKQSGNSQPEKRIAPPSCPLICTGWLFHCLSLCRPLATLDCAGHLRLAIRLWPQSTSPRTRHQTTPSNAAAAVEAPPPPPSLNAISIVHQLPWLLSIDTRQMPTPTLFHRRRRTLTPPAPSPYPPPLVSIAVFLTQSHHHCLSIFHCRHRRRLLSTLNAPPPTVAIERRIHCPPPPTAAAAVTAAATGHF